jgi:hypothetical protein
MTDEIDLDELDVESDDQDTPNRGDWFWRGEGDPADEPEAPTTGSDSSYAPSVDPATADSGAASGDGTDSGDVSSDPIPHVPGKNKDKPVGIPKESGGAGAEPATGGDSNGAAAPPEEASGPHGGGIDDMTLALTYQAMKEVTEPLLVVQDAKQWSDWVGIVGEVEAHIINKFQRDHNIDVDFFSGSGQSAAERLADIDDQSMFYAERMVVVGRPSEEELAERVGWEFIPLPEAAEKADWELSDDAD